MSTLPPLSGPPLYRYIPGVGKVASSVPGIQGPAGPPGLPSIQGRVLRVDQLYGNDVSGGLNKYANPFQTIMGALSNVIAGEVVEILPGTYNETLVVPANVSLQGIGAQAVVIQQLNCTSNTTLLTMGSNSRVENFTANLSSSSNVNLTGVLFPQGTIPTAKLRNSIWTITSTATGSNAITGCLSPGTSTLDFFPANMIQRSTINVISSSAGNSRGILINNASRFAVRDIVVYARGSGSNIVGGEVTDASGILEFKTSTIGGQTTDVAGLGHDINRAAGRIIVGASDLLNNDANGNSFDVTQQCPMLSYGVNGNLGANRRYYLVMGTETPGNITNTSNAVAYAASNAIPFPFDQKTIAIAIAMTFTGSLNAGSNITFSLHRNRQATSVMSLTMGSTDGTTKYIKTISAVFDQGDTIDATLDTSGNPGDGFFSASVTLY
jgi:hypothetical protein